MKNIRGFTLIELLTVVAIIGIIAAIAYPSYLNSIRKSNRSDAQVTLSQDSQTLERCYTQYGTYNSSSCPTLLGTSPQGYYSITTPALTSTTYIIRATPVATGPQAKDTDCPKIEINNTGARTPTDCWQS